jgi:hypothetical protein
MIKAILEGLQYDVSGEFIDIAKGKYKLEETLKEVLTTINKEWRKK